MSLNIPALFLTEFFEKKLHSFVFSNGFTLPANLN